MTKTLNELGTHAIENLYATIEENGYEVVDNISFENDQRSIILVCDEHAEYSDEKFIFESYFASEVYEFLKANNYLELA